MDEGANHMGRESYRVIRNRPWNIRQGNSYTLRIRIKTLPALQYEGFDLSSFQFGHTYEVERRLAELLVERGYAEPDTRSGRDDAADKNAMTPLTRNRDRQAR
jgi:hypothetical protein